MADWTAADDWQNKPAGKSMIDPYKKNMPPIFIFQLFWRTVFLL